jgi:hypothetical protein
MKEKEDFRRWTCGQEGQKGPFETCTLYDRLIFNKIKKGLGMDQVRLHGQRICAMAILS